MAGMARVPAGMFTSFILPLLALGCGETADDDATQSDGSATASGAGGTGVVRSRPRGNLSFTFTRCMTYSGAVGSDGGINSLVATDGTQPGRRLEDGQEGASVDCTMSGEEPVMLDLRITGPQSHPSSVFLETVGMNLDGWIAAGTGEAAIELITGGILYRSVGNCALTTESARPNNQFTVETGRIYARFDCPELENPPTTGCTAAGAFTFERCGQ